MGIRIYLTDREAVDLLDVLSESETLIQDGLVFGENQPSIRRVYEKIHGALYAKATFVEYPEELDVEVRCGKCGKPMEAVRPGKWQCRNPQCEQGKLEVMW